MKKRIMMFINNEKDAFGNDKLYYLLDRITKSLLFLYFFSLPTMSYNALHDIPIVFAGMFIVLSSILLLKYYQIVIERIFVAFFVFVLMMGISFLFNRNSGFSQTPFLMVIIFLFIYHYLYVTNNRYFGLISLGSSIFLFGLVFFIVYAKPILSLEFNRLGSAFGLPTNVSLYFGIAVILFLYAILKNRNYLLIAPTLFLTVLGLTTGSKSFILLLVVAAFIIVFSHFGMKKWYISLAIIGVGIAVIVIALQLDAFKTYRQRFLDMFKLLIYGDEFANTDASTAQRMNMINEGIILFFKKPIFGWGMNGFTNYGSFGTYSHNALTEVGANFGLFALMAFEYPIYLAIRKYRANKERDLSFLLILMYIIFSMMISVQYTDKQYYVMLALLLVTVLNNDNNPPIATLHFEGKRPVFQWHYQRKQQINESSNKNIVK